MLRSGRLAAPLSSDDKRRFIFRQSQKGPFPVLTLAESFAALPLSQKGPLLVLSRAVFFAAQSLKPLALRPPTFVETTST